MLRRRISSRPPQAKAFMASVTSFFFASGLPRLRLCFHLPSFRHFVRLCLPASRSHFFLFACPGNSLYPLSGSNSSAYLFPDTKSILPESESSFESASSYPLTASSLTRVLHQNYSLKIPLFLCVEIPYPLASKSQTNLPESSLILSCGNLRFLARFHSADLNSLSAESKFLQPPSSISVSAFAV